MYYFAREHAKMCFEPQYSKLKNHFEKSSENCHSVPIRAINQSTEPDFFCHSCNKKSHIWDLLFSPILVGTSATEGEATVVLQ